LAAARPEPKTDIRVNLIILFLEPHLVRDETNMNAKYLVRFDDICPTMNWSVWQAVEEILVEADVKPILAVIADNQDDILKVDAPKEAFWDRVRGWRDRGWTIGMHGYQHRYVTADSGIVGLLKYSEFAGVPTMEQAVKIKQALDVFQREAVRPEVWIAPAHSFDRTTVNLLREAGLRRISDGFFLFPNLDSRGMLWIPVQLWRFQPMLFGVWSVCLHINRWSPRDILQFQRDVKRYRTKIVSFQDVVNRYAERRPDWRDKFFQITYPQYLRTRSTLSPWVRRIVPRKEATG
jgi:predicted deacetylase